MEEREALASQLAVIASPVRLALLDRLVAPAFAPELEEELGITRQSLKRHLDQLVESGLLEARDAKRGIFPATQYVASATGIFALKESVMALATPPTRAAAASTVPSRATTGAQAAPGAGLLLVHGHRRGEWFPFEGARTITIGRDGSNEVALPWDPFASARHALLDVTPAGCAVRDLNARNGTFVDFQQVESGSEVALPVGGILGVGKSLFVLRG